MRPPPVRLPLDRRPVFSQALAPSSGLLRPAPLHSDRRAMRIKASNIDEARAPDVAGLRVPEREAGRPRPQARDEQLRFKTPEALSSLARGGIVRHRARWP